MSELVFHRRGEELMRVALDRVQTTLGRGDQNDVALPDPAVSRTQCRIEQRGSRFVLLDLSEKGTRVGGKVETEYELSDGSEIELGEWRAIVREGPSPELSTATAGRDATLRLSDEARPPLEGPFQLRIRSEGGEQILPLTTDDLSIGKDDENQLVLSDPYVSSFHVQLSRTGRGFWARDLGSTNGTFLNGARVREAEVPVGTLLRVGETELTLESVASPPRSTVFDGIVGRDPALLQILDLIERVAPNPVSVAIFGETGTGKELVARAIHTHSLRHDRPFVAVNCASLHRELVESELFGHEKGAFTGAIRAHTGAFEAASTGTLFLDEVAELPLDLQAKLLRVLEEGEVRRLGSDKPTRVDVRIVTATHRDLLMLCRAGKFREDLYYRLCVFPLTLPPLRRRPGDLAPLTDLFLARFGPPGVAITVSPEARAQLATYAFPGNVRELRSVVQRALLHRRGQTILPEHLSFDPPPANAEAAAAPADDDTWLRLTGLTLEQVKDEARKRAIRRHGGNKSHAAAELGVSRSTLAGVETDGAD